MYTAENKHSSRLHHYSNQLPRTPPKKTVSHNIAPLVPLITSLQPSFCDIDLIVRDKKRSQEKLKKRSLPAILDEGHQKPRVDVSVSIAAKKIIFYKRLPSVSRGNASTTHSLTISKSNNLYRERLQAVLPAVKKSSGAEGERYTRLRGDWLSRMSPVFQGACKEIEKRVIKRAGKTRCWISAEDSWCVITYVITGFSNVLCWIAWCVCVWNGLAIGSSHWTRALTAVRMPVLFVKYKEKRMDNCRNT